MDFPVEVGADWWKFGGRVFQSGGGRFFEGERRDLTGQGMSHSFRGLERGDAMAAANPAGIELEARYRMAVQT
jgi:hypothetical protein